MEMMRRLMNGFSMTNLEYEGIPPWQEKRRTKLEGKGGNLIYQVDVMDNTSNCNIIAISLEIYYFITRTSCCRPGPSQL